ncbi:MAG: hypothetical protein EZS28_013462 [Streblomastix strix]|uniref:Uncharacterized protein n=1 Tax=Streblomastix strix TaxID=222440 RepID=A0A5J4W840_9EUKA|nr:MAG: hypothetical protein EZS28_013462 [Streblomastix strix]
MRRSTELEQPEVMIALGNQTNQFGKICPSTWLTSWFARRCIKDQTQPLWWRKIKNKKKVSYEYLSKAVHLIMKGAVAQTRNFATSI